VRYLQRRTRDWEESSPRPHLHQVQRQLRHLLVVRHQLPLLIPRAGDAGDLGPELHGPQPIVRGSGRVFIAVHLLNHAQRQGVEPLHVAGHCQLFDHRAHHLLVPLRGVVHPQRRQRRAARARRVRPHDRPRGEVPQAVVLERGILGKNVVRVLHPLDGRDRAEDAGVGPLPVGLEHPVLNGGELRLLLDRLPRVGPARLLGLDLVPGQAIAVELDAPLVRQVELVFPYREGWENRTNIEKLRRILHVRASRTCATSTTHGSHPRCGTPARTAGTSARGRSR
jgi:hypothetical protein